MKRFYLALLLAQVSWSWAAPFGEILWEAGSTPSQFARGGQAKKLYLPWAPIGKIASKDTVKIAIIDSGVMTDHPQLKGFILDSIDFTGEGMDDVLGHGTSVALNALFSASGDESPGAVLSTKVVNAKGQITKENVMKAINWAATKRARVVNLSLGFRGDITEFADLCDLIASNKDVLFMAAAGNYGPNVRVYPASCKAANLISVAAVDEKGKPLSTSGLGNVAALGKVLFLSEGRYWYEQGQELSRKQRFGEARAMYEKALEAEPLPEAQFQLGLQDLYENAVDAAIRRFQAAVKIDPGLAIAHEHLGAAYFLKNDLERARRSLQEAITLEPENPRAHFNLGQIYLRQGRAAEAKNEFQEVKRLEPNYPNIDDALRQTQLNSR